MSAAGMDDEDEDDDTAHAPARSKAGANR